MLRATIRAAFWWRTQSHWRPQCEQFTTGKWSRYCAARPKCRLDLIPLRKMLIELARHNASGLSARGLTSVIYGKPVVSAGHFLQRWASYQLAENTRPP